MKGPLPWLASLLHLRRQVQFVAWALPNRHWYRAALAMCRLQGAINGALGGNRVLTEAVMLDNWLSELTEIGSFPIPYILNRIDDLEAGDPRIGTLHCWIHEPLVEFLMRPLLEQGYSEPIVVADPGRIIDGDRIMVPGTAKRLMAIPAEKSALRQARRLLLDGISVICLADEYLGGPLQPVVLRLAGRVGARVVFQWAVRRPDGVIEVTFRNAPHPYCETDDAVRENLAFLQEAQQRAFRTLRLAADSKSPP
jgi:hypothetical protein